MNEYGHLHLSLFYRRALRIHTHGVSTRLGYHPAQTIRHIETWTDPWPAYGAGYGARQLPRARIHFSDGSSLRLRGDALIKRNAPLLPGYTTELDEILSLLHRMRS